MKKWTKNRYSSCFRRICALQLAVLLLALVGAANAQGTKVDAESVKKSLLRVEQGQFDAGDVHKLAQANATQSIPALRKQFAATKDAILKEFIASALVKLGDESQKYWDFLAARARSALENDAPSPILFDSNGNSVRGQLSPEYLSWAKAHHVNPSDDAGKQIYENPIPFGLLAKTGDPRGRMILRNGLSSRNYIIQSFAAKGLAKLKDKDSIPLIIDACRKAPAEVAAPIAEALVYFDDARAQAAAERFISNKLMLEELRKRSREKGADPFLY